MWKRCKAKSPLSFEAFPNGTVWGNLNTDGQGYDVVLVGQAEQLKIDVDDLAAAPRPPRI